MKDCKNCKWYTYKPNILGGIAECLREVKPMNVFHPNQACEQFEKK